MIHTPEYDQIVPEEIRQLNTQELARLNSLVGKLVVWAWCRVDLGSFRVSEVCHGSVTFTAEQNPPGHRTVTTRSAVPQVLIQVEPENQLKTLMPLSNYRTIPVGIHTLHPEHGLLKRHLGFPLKPDVIIQEWFTVVEPPPNHTW